MKQDIRASAAPAVTGSPIGSVSVWLTDDNEEIRGLLIRFLEQGDIFRCTAQFGSAEAMLWALSRRAAPEVILLDNQLPGMSGVDAIKSVLALAPGTRVLMLTSFRDEATEWRALAAGASAFLCKYADGADLPFHIFRALSQPRQPDGSGQAVAPVGVQKNRPVA